MTAAMPIVRRPVAVLSLINAGACISWGAWLLLIRNGPRVANLLNAVRLAFDTDAPTAGSVLAGLGAGFLVVGLLLVPLAFTARRVLRRLLDALAGLLWGVMCAIIWPSPVALISAPLWGVFALIAALAAVWQVGGDLPVAPPGVGEHVAEGHGWLFWDVKPLEVVTGVGSYGWGAWIIVFQSFATTPTYRVMGALFPELAWGTIFMLVGTAQIIALRRRWRTARIWAAVAFMIVWLFAWLTFVLSNYRATGTWIYGLWIAKAVWIITHHEARRRLAR